MADVVTDHVNNLKAAVQAVASVAGRNLYVYDQDDLFYLAKQLQPPCAGIVYVGMQGKNDGTRTGLAANLLIDIYVIGAEANNMTADDAKPSTTQLLAEIRNGIKETIAPSKHRWKFEFESPVDISDETRAYMAYVQRWSTTVLLTN